MAPLLLRFAIVLEDRNEGLLSRRYGPLFHRWLPDGAQDAIELKTGDPGVCLRVWFERRGYMDGAFAKFDHDRQEIDPEAIPELGVLDAGPMRGLLQIDNPTPDELRVLRDVKTGNDAYRALGKRIVKKLIHTPVSRFLDILRVTYGQHWLSTLEPWDSRSETLGDYCMYSLHLKWSLDGGEKWQDFIPEEPSKVVHLSVHLQSSFSEYLSEADWQELGRILQTDYEPSPAAEALSSAHSMLDTGHTKQALIEGVTALEIGMKEFLRHALRARNDLLNKTQALYQIPLPAQVISLAGPLDSVSPEDLDRALKTIVTNGASLGRFWPFMSNQGAKRGF